MFDYVCPLTHAFIAAVSAVGIRRHGDLNGGDNSGVALVPVSQALCALLELPFERVIVSHGDPVHDRAAYERALELPPWGE